MPIIGIGLHFKLMTDSYRSSIEALVSRDVVAMERIPTTVFLRMHHPRQSCKRPLFPRADA